MLDGDRVALRSTTAGSHVVSRPDGSSATVVVHRVREPITPSSWTLILEDWKPVNASDSTVLDTVREEHTAELGAPSPWSRVAGLEDASGIGRYRTTLDLGDDWTDADGAVLELGEVNDTFRVRVNGKVLPPCDPLDTTVDLGHRLRPGANVVEVEVASTLLNRLRVVTPAVYGPAARQAYGLSGPVRLVPYVEVAVPH